MTGGWGGAPALLPTPPQAFRGVPGHRLMIFDRELPKAAGVLHHCCPTDKEEGTQTMTTAPAVCNQGTGHLVWPLPQHLRGLVLSYVPVGWSCW